MQEIHTKLLISRLSLVQNIFYHYIHGMKRLIIPIITWVRNKNKYISLIIRNIAIKVLNL